MATASFPAHRYLHLHPILLQHPVHRHRRFLRRLGPQVPDERETVYVWHPTWSVR